MDGRRTNARTETKLLKINFVLKNVIRFINFGVNFSFLGNFCIYPGQTCLAVFKH